MGESSWMRLRVYAMSMLCQTRGSEVMLSEGKRIGANGHHMGSWWWDAAGHQESSGCVDIGDDPMAWSRSHSLNVWNILWGDRWGVCYWVGIKLFPGSSGKWHGEVNGCNCYIQMVCVELLLGIMLGCHGLFFLEGVVLGQAWCVSSG